MDGCVERSQYPSTLLAGRFSWEIINCCDQLVLCGAARSAVRSPRGPLELPVAALAAPRATDNPANTIQKESPEYGCVERSQY